MHVHGPSSRQRTPGKWFFLFVFLFACLLFWWLPSVLFRLVFHLPDPVEDSAIATSYLALAMFAAGYLLPGRGRAGSQLPRVLFDASAEFSYRATIVIAVPATAIAALLWYSRVGVAYGMADPAPTPFQAVLYTHLFFGFMYLGAAVPEKHGWRRVLTVVALVTLPRLIDSLNGGRFFLAQAIVPAALIAVARGWIRFSAKRILQFAALALIIVFLPSVTRGDEYFGREESLGFFAAGGSLRLFQDNTELNLNGRCPPLLVSMTAKAIPWGAMGVCVIDVWRLKSIPATLDRILAYNEPGSDVQGTGPGSNFLLELYLSGGMTAVVAGSALFGFSCRRFIGWIGKRSLFAGIWAECLTRALFAPRGNLGYVFERIPSLVLATLLVVLVVWAGLLLRSGAASSRAVEVQA